MTLKTLLSAAAVLMATAALAQPKVIAHRGYWKTEGSAQNSITALHKADEIAAFGSEFDVWLTADNELVVNHDRVFVGTDIHMEQDKFDRIRTIRLSNKEVIPSLDEYLKAGQYVETRLVLEMKPLRDVSREKIAVKKIVKALRQYHLTDNTDFISFSLNACHLFHEKLPDVDVYYLNGDLTPQEIHDFGFAGMDYSMGTYRKHPEWVKECHDLGLKVNVWTVNTEEDMRYFIDLGVDMITTNEPELLQHLLREHEAETEE